MRHTCEDISDADSRLKSRWSLVKGTTYYDNDAVGNLTAINYPSSTDLTFQYVALDRPTTTSAS